MLSDIYVNYVPTFMINFFLCVRILIFAYMHIFA